MTPPRLSTAHPAFIELNGRRLFTLRIAPTGPRRAAVLYLPPFAEEMNRCRSHVVAQARALAATGHDCLLLDPFGTGESDGLFAEATWTHWRDDAEAAARWWRSQTGGPLTVWGIRTGALLAAEVATGGRADVDRLLFWQPVLDGKLFLTQHLRLRIASQMVHDTERETTETIRARLSAGEDIEIAGYPLSGRLADGLATARMPDAAALARCRIDWIEVVAKPEQPLAPVSRRLVDAVLAAGGALNAHTVADPLIWQLQERDDAPALHALSLRLMGEPA